MTTDAIREDGFYWVRDHDDAAPWIPAELSRTYWFLPGAGAGMAQSDLYEIGPRILPPDEAAQAKAAAPADGEPSVEEWLRPYLFEGEYILQPDEAKIVLDAFAARRVAEAVAAERAKPDASESAAKIWYERIDKQPTVHGKIEELSAIIAEARRAERERCAQIADNDAALGRVDLDDPSIEPLAGARILAAERIAAAIRNPQ